MFGEGGSTGATDLDGGSDDGAAGSTFDADDAQTPDVAADAAEDGKDSNSGVDVDVDAVPVSVIDAAIATEAGSVGFDAALTNKPLLDDGGSATDLAIDGARTNGGDKGCDCHVGSHSASDHLSGLWIVGLGCIAALIRRKRRRD
jgi:hypothetical protein